jgi:predicted CoA-substrate-specific enzyme activase
VASAWDVAHENEFLALARGVAALIPAARTVLEMGGETSKFLLLEPDGSGMSLRDYEANGDCAAGTGSFIDQQAVRLGCAVEDIGDMVARATRTPKIAGRCSVFAKSDMIHAQQRGFTPDEVLAGLCDAVARNFRASVTKSRKVVTPAVFVGGVAGNSAVLAALRRAFSLETELFVPAHHAHLTALGAALLESAAAAPRLPGSSVAPLASWGSMPRLSMERVELLRNRTSGVDPLLPGERRPAFLGIDVGSVSTNLAVVDDKGGVLWELYVRTRARPIEVVRDALRRMDQELGDCIRITGVGATGSGRELIGALVGADVVKDEITAHKTGACFVAAEYLGSGVDTILEIGGQDAKYIRVQDGVVVDFTMNDACAAGTGSFLEERAGELGVSIVDEFARLALSSDRPVRLGERCTVFMERDVNGYLRQGAPIKDIAAGLAYSVVQNYVNRVVRGRPIDGVVFFQGGTAYNDAVAAAFSEVVGATIVVPPYNGVIGAIGVALLARDWARESRQSTAFRGLALDRVSYGLREFTCRGCQNFCSIQEFTVEGEKSYWGDQCSDRFRSRQRVLDQPVTNDLYRRYLDSLPHGSAPSRGPVIGIPRVIHFVELLPFWRGFFDHLGLSTLISPWTSKALADRGVESTVAEPCFPVKVSHGHLSWLMDQGVDAVFLPAIIDRATTHQHTESFACVWGQTLPHVMRASPALRGLRDRVIAPALRFRSPPSVGQELALALARFGVSRTDVDAALAHAARIQDGFAEGLRAAGREALGALHRAARPGVVLVGRPYNIYDRLICLDVPSKLRDTYGVDVIPMDFLDLESVSIQEILPGMYWSYGRRIIAAAKVTASDDLLNLIYISNFKCGPDSFIKHYIYRAGRKPFLTLHFDGHANDAGIMTRCEAFLESKGMMGRRTRRPRASQFEAA